MKHIFTICSILLATFAFSQETTTKKLAEFSELSVQGRLTVKLEKSDVYEMEILIINAAEVDIDNLKMEYSGNKLDIKYSGGSLKDIEMELTIKCPSLSRLEARQGVEIRAENSFPFKGAKIFLHTFAGGKMEVNVNHDWVEAKVNQGGSIRVQGSTKHFEASVVTGGTIGASFLNADKVDAEVKFGGDIICNAIEILTAKVTSGGEITYKGDPEVTQKVTLGGSITKSK